jgi:hypothetical protein
MLGIWASAGARRAKSVTRVTVRMVEEGVEKGWVEARPASEKSEEGMRSTARGAHSLCTSSNAHVAVRFPVGYRIPLMINGAGCPYHPSRLIRASAHDSIKADLYWGIGHIKREGQAV